jgi:hypothetical protein
LAIAHDRLQVAAQLKAEGKLKEASSWGQIALQALKGALKRLWLSLEQLFADSGFEYQDPDAWGAFWEDIGGEG